MYRHVCTMYVQRIYNAIVRQQSYMVYKFLEMCIHVHVYTFLRQMFIRVCTWYVHDMYFQRYTHVCTSFKCVCTRIYMYIRDLNHIHMYIQSTNMYVQSLCN
jgi:hypothetical protein